jgi:hypothetical protein
MPLFALHKGILQSENQLLTKTNESHRLDSKQENAEPVWLCGLYKVQQVAGGTCVVRIRQVLASGGKEVGGTWKGYEGISGEWKFVLLIELCM